MDVDGGFCTHNLRGHTGIVHPVCFSPSSTTPRVAAASGDNAVWLWNLSDNS